MQMNGQSLTALLHLFDTFVIGEKNKKNGIRKQKITVEKSCASGKR